MRTQTRWACGSCHREWIFKKEGPEDTCPVCGIKGSRVEYQGLFDIHTPADVMRGLHEAPLRDAPPPPAQRQSEIVPPPMTLANEDLWRP